MKIFLKNLPWLASCEPDYHRLSRPLWGRPAVLPASANVSEASFLLLLVFSPTSGTIPLLARMLAKRHSCFSICLLKAFKCTKAVRDGKRQRHKSPFGKIRASGEWKPLDAERDGCRLRSGSALAEIVQQVVRLFAKIAFPSLNL